MDWWTSVNTCSGAGPVGGTNGTALSEMNQIDAGLFDPWIHCDDLDLGTILHQAGATGQTSANTTITSSSSTSTSVSSSSPVSMSAVSRSNTNIKPSLLPLNHQIIVQTNTSAPGTQSCQQHQHAIENVTSISSTQCSSSTSGSISSLDSSPINNNNNNNNNNNSGSTTNSNSNPSGASSGCILNNNNQICYLASSPSSSSPIFVQTPSSPILVQTSSLLVHDSTIVTNATAVDDTHYNQPNMADQHLTGVNNVNTAHLLQQNHQHHQYLSQQLNSSNNLHYQQHPISTSSNGPVSTSTTTSTTTSTGTTNNHPQLQGNRRVNIDHQGAYGFNQHQLSIMGQEHPQLSHSIVAQHHLHQSMNGNDDISSHLQIDSKDNLKEFLSSAGRADVNIASSTDCSRRSSYDPTDLNNNNNDLTSSFRKQSSLIHVDDTHQHQLLANVCHQQPLKSIGSTPKQSLSSVSASQTIVTTPLSETLSRQSQQQRPMSSNQRQNYNGRTMNSSIGRKSASCQSSNSTRNNSSSNNNNKSNSQQQLGGNQPKIRRCRHITDFVLGEEEKRLLIKEGYEDFPMNCQDGPLTRTEERILRKIRRKIRNKKSAQCSRQRKKEYVEELERKYANIFRENQEMRKILEQIQRDQHQQLLPANGSSTSSPVPGKQHDLMANNLLTSNNIIEWKMNHD